MSNNHNASKKNIKKANSGEPDRRVIPLRRFDNELLQGNGQRADRHSPPREPTSVPRNNNQAPRKNHPKRPKNNNAIAEVVQESMEVDESHDTRHNALQATLLAPKSKLAPKKASKEPKRQIRIKNLDHLWALMDGRFKKIEKRISALETSVGGLEKRVGALETKVEKYEKRRIADGLKRQAVEYEIIALSWIGYKVQEWWGCTPRRGIHGAVFKPKTAGYVKAFKATKDDLMGPNRKLFRDLHSALKSKDAFYMFDELEYNGLGTARAPNNNTLAPTTFVSPSKRGSMAGDNTVVIVEMTTKNLCPTSEIIKAFVNHVESNESSLEMMARFEEQCIHEGGAFPRSTKDFDRLRSLLLKLLQMEKQVTLQLHRYHNTDPALASQDDVRSKMCCALVSTSEPDNGTLRTLLASPKISKALFNVSRLFKRDKFKTLSYRLNYRSFS